MTMRNDLDRALQAVKLADNSGGVLEFSDAGDNAFYLLRDHGPALLEALADAERLDWLSANPHMLYTSHDDGPIAHFVAVDERVTPRRGNVASTVRQAIDRAREGV